jgi:DNA primase
MKLSIEKLKEILPDATPDRRGKYMVATCPNCGQREFTISLDDNHKCGCNRKKKCGWVGNIFSLAKKLGKFSVLNIEGDVGQVDKLENKIIKANQSYELDLPTIKMPVGWQRVYQDEYLDGRNFTEYERYKVGRTVIHPKLKKNYVITAIEEGGEIKGYIGRHIWDKVEIDSANKKRSVIGLPEILRYSNSATDFSKLLFGYDEIKDQVTKTIICVEGIFDKWNIDKLMMLHDQDVVKCNATFKCAISIEQMIKWKIKGIETLILFYDPDVINQIKRVASELQLWFNVLIAFNDDADVDAGEINEVGLSKVFSNLKSVSDFNSSKVVSSLKN